jgi:hypothetical protein
VATVSQFVREGIQSSGERRPTCFFIIVRAVAGRVAILARTGPSEELRCAQREASKRSCHAKHLLACNASKHFDASVPISVHACLRGRDGTPLREAAWQWKPSTDDCAALWHMPPATTSDKNVASRHGCRVAGGDDDGKYWLKAVRTAHRRRASPPHKRAWHFRYWRSRSGCLRSARLGCLRRAHVVADAARQTDRLRQSPTRVQVRLPVNLC